MAGLPDPTLEAVVSARLADIAKQAGPLEQARQLGELLGELSDQAAQVTAVRDGVLVDMLSEPGVSQRKLAAQVGLPHQRISQLAAHARAGGRKGAPGT